MEDLPAGAKTRVFVEVNDAGDEIPLQTDADLELTWLHRNGAKPGTTKLLEEAIRAQQFPAGRNFIWAAGEAGALKPIRRHLLRERGVKIEWLSMTGHWKYKVADWDHHEPIDDEA